MKLAILLNSDVMEKNQCQIRIQPTKISEDLLVSSNAQIFVALCNYRPLILEEKFRLLKFRSHRDKSFPFFRLPLQQFSVILLGKTG